MIFYNSSTRVARFFFAVVFYTWIPGRGNGTRRDSLQGVVALEDGANALHVAMISRENRPRAAPVAERLPR
jgi:hypothetical protein